MRKAVEHNLANVVQLWITDEQAWMSRANVVIV